LRQFAFNGARSSIQEAIMMQLITGECYGNFINELAEMHRLRYRVFKERLGARPDRGGERAFVARYPAQAAFARVNSLRRL